MNIDDSSYVTLTGNTLYNGGPEQVYIPAGDSGIGRAAELGATNGSTGSALTNTSRMTGNTFHRKREPTGLFLLLRRQPVLFGSHNQQMADLWRYLVIAVAIRGATARPRILPIRSSGPPS